MRGTARLLATVLLLGGCSTERESNTDEPAREAFAPAAYLAGAETLVDSFAQAWNSHDSRAFADIFADDATWVTVSGMRLKGRAEIESFLEKEHATWARTTTVTNTAVEVRPMRPDLAAIFFRWEIVDATGADGRAAGPVRGGTMVVASRQMNRWIVVAGQVSRDPSGEVMSQ